MYLIYLILLCYAHLTYAEPSSKLLPSFPTVSTCPYRTVNYITHVLPQQCLTASRNSTSFSTPASAQETEPRVSHVSIITAVETPSQKFAPKDQEGRKEKSIDGVLVGSVDPENSASAFAQGEAPKSSDSPEITDEDSPLESGNFLSFEEWKKQSLKKAGQSEHVGKAAKPEVYESRNRLAQVQNSLDSLGDDGEIDIDFSGFVPDGPQKSVLQAKDIPMNQEIPEPDLDSPPKIKLRSKDAGTTCKERFNYASFDCAANVLKTNPAAQSPLSVLSENKDAYMLNKCSADNKFLILELCNDISIDTVVLANFEFFSSTFRTFRVSVSDRYPVKIEKWKTLGIYEARNSREVQAFLVENPVIWARYLRIEFLSHYGNEFYCPVSLVRVHGTTMLEEYKHDLEAGLNDDVDDEDDATLNGVPDADKLALQAVTDPQDLAEAADGVTDQALELQSSSISQTAEAAVKTSQLVDFSAPATALQHIMSAVAMSNTCLPEESPSVTSSNIYEHGKTTSQPNKAATGFQDTQHVSSKLPTDTNSLAKDKKSDTVSDATVSSSKSEIAKGSKTTKSKSSSIATKASESEKQKSASHSVDRNNNSTTTNDRSKVATSASVAPHSAPTMQESFFKSVQKRLQMLESNSSLSLQYIEDQSRALRDAFKKVEQRQLAKTTTFLEQLNTTVLNELREFRQQYDQLWQSTVIELEMQRERYERDNAAINARLGILADEVIFQRRMGILQMILILVCLVLVLFSRGAIHNYLELPIVQNVLARSPSSRWLNLSGVDSPSRTPQMSRTRSAHQLRTGEGILKNHRRMDSDDSNLDAMSSNDLYAPPTPVSFDGLSDTTPSKNTKNTNQFESDVEDTGLGDPGFDPSSIERPNTSPPAVPNGRLTPVSDGLAGQSNDVSIDARLSAPGHIDYQLAPPRLVVEGCSPAKRLSWNIPNDLSDISDT